MNISIPLALSLAGPPNLPTRNPSRRTLTHGTNIPKRTSSRGFSIYKGVSDRPLGWKPRREPKRTVSTPELREPVFAMSIQKWDGPARRAVDWDGMRKDPELWYRDGNVLVHLYEQGQSRRGPAFKLPMEALLYAKCQPLLDRFMVGTLAVSPSSKSISSEEEYFNQNTKVYELYIPPPADVDRAQAFLYHTATRNFFAWIFGKSLVGHHLGGALVGLLNSMNQFRSAGEDNVQDIIDYMDEEGYSDMRNTPDHALAVLFFAEHFHFKNLWIDAFVHCTGMNEKLIASPGFEFTSRKTRALVTRSRLEMDIRLDDCGKRLGSFHSDDLSDAHLGLSSAARAHLDKFRGFLQSYYIAKLGYYPPVSDSGRAAFPKHTYAQMCGEFQKLHDYLVDSDRTVADGLPVSQQGGVCVWQCLQAFDQRHKYESLPNPFPLLPEMEDKSRPPSNRRFSFTPKGNKMKPDPRLVTLAHLAKATNGHDQAVRECTLVRAYKGFEKDCVMSPTKGDRLEKLSQTDARKVRWILVYSILQTLLSATVAPKEVRDTHNVPYNICVLVAGCPHWKSTPYETLLRTQTDQAKDDFKASMAKSVESFGMPSSEIRPDIDYVKIAHGRTTSTSSTLSSVSSKKSSVRRALSTLGNMPELRHPKPQRQSHHEILVQGYGNGTNSVSIAAGSDEALRKSTDSTSSSDEIASSWSNTSYDEADSPTTSLASESRRGSDASAEAFNKSINNFLDRPMSALGLSRMPSSVYSQNLYDEHMLPPAPLQVNKPEECMRITNEVKVEWEETNSKANDGLLTYLKA